MIISSKAVMLDVFKTGITSQRGADRKLGIGNAEEYYSFDPQVAPSDVGLPKDWTY